MTFMELEEHTTVAGKLCHHDIDKEVFLPVSVNPEDPTLLVNRWLKITVLTATHEAVKINRENDSLTHILNPDKPIKIRGYQSRQD